MNVRIAALADYASISLGDKLNILGIFSTIMARAEPVLHTQMQLVVQLEFEPGEAGNKDVRVILQGQDGGEVLSLQGQIAAPRAPRGELAVVNQILQLNNVSFPHFGHYEFQILMNGQRIATVPLLVRRVTETPPEKLVA